MTFLEAAFDILRKEGRPLHYKDLTERALGRKLLTFVGRTPEVTMQTQLTAAVKKAPGSPFVRVKPGTFGLLRYPAASAAPEPAPSEKEKDREKDAGKDKDKVRDKDAPAAEAGEARGERGRRRRRGGRGRGPRGREEARDAAPAAGAAASAAGDDDAEERDEPTAIDAPDEQEPEVGSLSPEARAAALAESGVLESEGDGGDDDEDEGEDVDQGGDDAGEAFAAAGD